MSLQSRFVGGGEGESRRKNSYGDPLPLVERTADAKTSKNAVKAPVGSNVPFGKLVTAYSVPGNTLRDAQKR